MAWSDASYSRNASLLEVVVRSRSRWHGARSSVRPPRMVFVVRLLNTFPPLSVAVNGKEAAQVSTRPAHLPTRVA